MPQFNYPQAFSRNIGWLTPEEQRLLQNRCIAIAGLGGVGGAHLLTLTRLGIGRFQISDLDHFEVANFNRQVGAKVSTLGRAKVDVLAGMALDINPELEIGRFPEGVDKSNVDAFLEGVDLYVDGLDYFALDARRTLFAACEARGIPAVTAAPLGMGAAVLTFMPGRMDFETYFQVQGVSEQEQLLRFLLGLSPAMLQRGYLVHPEAVDFMRHRGPSTPMACDICAGMAATEALKILLRRGPVRCAPRGMQFDAYRNRFVRTWRPGGNRNPLQRLGLAIARRQLDNMGGQASPWEEQGGYDRPLERILDAARWAPSGDNTQPWRFRLLDEERFEILGEDTRDWCVYDLQGRASQIALGALLESIVIAASMEGRRVRFMRREQSPEARPVIEAVLERDAAIEPDALYPQLRCRTTQRRMLDSEPLSTSARTALEASVGSGYRVIWVEGGRDKWRMARLLFENAHIRLTIPEAYRVHRAIIHWNARYSRDRIPDQALGIADPLTLRLMRWAMQSWSRVQFLNRYFGGTLMPRLQLDLLPALRCAAHFVLVAERQPVTIDDYMEGGRRLQRFWLTATRLGLLLQPEMTPLIFARYVREGIRFSTLDRAQAEAIKLSDRLEALIGRQACTRALFMGRLGRGTQPQSRSLRRPLEQLLVHGEEDPRRPAG